MSTELPRYEYRLGFRYAANVRSIESAGQYRTQKAVAPPLERIRCLQQDSFAATNRRPTKPDEAGVEVAAVHPTSPARLAPCVRNGRDLAAISIQRVVRGWRARVWAVQVVHDRAWKALLLIQATWRGALVRHQLRKHPTTTKASLFVEQRQDDASRRNKTQHHHHHHHHHQYHHHQHQHHQHHHQHQQQQDQHSRKQTTTVAVVGPDLSSYSSEQHQREERCPERAAWEHSWARVRLERPNFRDRVRVWQTIAELKRSGGRGRMGITNSEAWTALHESSGSALVAATRLSSEEYLLGRRLQDQKKKKEKNSVCEVPPYLSLDLASLFLVAPHRAGGGNKPIISSFLRRRRSLSLSSVTKRTSSEAVSKSRNVFVRGLPTEGEKTSGCGGGGGGGGSGTFECVSDIFYNASATASTTTTERKKKQTLRQ